jgi:hypothetical protein
MESARKIIDALFRGVSPQELAKEFPWEEIIGDASGELLKFAQNSPDNQHSFRVLAYLFRVANENDLWFATQVLSQTVRHPTLSSEERKMILANLRSLLDKIKNQIAAELPSQEKLRKYWLMEGGYYTVSGTTFAETGQLEEANQNYLIAQGIFKQWGLIPSGMKFDGSDTTLAAGEEQVSTEGKPAPAAKPESGQPEAPQVVNPSGPPAVESQPPAERPVSAHQEAYHPLPDVWLEDGQLHLPPLEMGEGEDEIRQQALQIEQQSEILSGIQLQIQMYLNRRSVLAREVQTLEKKTAALKAAVARLEKKVDNLGNSTV